MTQCKIWIQRRIIMWKRRLRRWKNRNRWSWSWRRRKEKVKKLDQTQPCFKMRDHSESNRGRLISVHHHVITRSICKVRLVSDSEWVSACILCVQEANDGSQRMCTTQIILTQNVCWRMLRQHSDTLTWLTQMRLSKKCWGYLVDEWFTTIWNTWIYCASMNYWANEWNDLRMASIIGHFV